MSTSGTALYSDDTASDVKDELVELLSRLCDPAQATGAWIVKTEIAVVSFALADGELISREGANRYQTGDALITGSTGDRWSMSRARFDAKYQPLAPLPHGIDGHYQARPRPVLARRIGEPFTVARSARGELLRGLALDWLLQYALGDYGLIENARFQKGYRAVPVSA